MDAFVQRRSMKAWRLDRLGGALRLEDAPIPDPRPGSVVVKVEASALMSYLKAYVVGRLPIYRPPDGPFTPGGLECVVLKPS
jgi:alcohol dehydrogenase